MCLLRSPVQASTKPVLGMRVLLLANRNWLIIYKYQIGFVPHTNGNWAIAALRHSALQVAVLVRDRHGHALISVAVSSQRDFYEYDMDINQTSDLISCERMFGSMRGS
jgi:hypothetical protein